MSTMTTTMMWTYLTSRGVYGSNDGGCAWMGMEWRGFESLDSVKIYLHLLRLAAGFALRGISGLFLSPAQLDT